MGVVTVLVKVIAGPLGFGLLIVVGLQLLAAVRRRHALPVGIGGPWRVLSRLVMAASGAAVFLLGLAFGYFPPVLAGAVWSVAWAWMAFRTGLRFHRFEPDDPHPLSHRPRLAWPWTHACALDPDCAHERRELLYIHPLRVYLDFGPRTYTYGWKDLAS